ncbi:glycoside hydrolase family 43 protein [Halopiger xanaduensis]|uniref:Glycoside hydrolase family 43 n=1 Tax=Halopiger xanaduensis (strain DSM 18323 / JCM 14033 / SH-6) TaxID=797210 RepID=F8DDG7_HALXS|nr:glycoside hydrolase family 43 protein [Halopiger xanaduensis]AEH39061.1 hypothetical protein Halxa_0460 [Halopiger xanaduensis SH-6]
MFVLAHFRTDSEALHYAVSDDGYEWEPINGGDAVLRSDVGAESIRDPFLIEDRNGTYHLLGTDGWQSENVVHATSGDLIEWSDPELIPVMEGVPGVRNAWAPECFYDRGVGVYRLVWSSTVDPSDATAVRDHRIWTCSTADFETYSAPATLFDPGYNVIDACVVRVDDEYLMAFKDERGENTVDTDHKDVRLATAPSGGGPFGDVMDPVTPSPVEGPTVFHNGEEWLMLYDRFVEGRYGASRSDDARHWEVCDSMMDFPDGLRHGDVIEVPDDVGERLRDTF